MASQSVEIRTGFIGRRGKPLTLWAFLHILHSVFEHLGLKISLVDGLVGEGSSARVVPTITIMDPRIILLAYFGLRHLRYRS